MTGEEHIVVLGGGMGGLSAALGLTSKGLNVTLVEKESRIGGKIRELEVAGRCIDAGPTVITMPWVLEELFEQVGANLSTAVCIQPLEVLARHFWPDGTMLDLFADIERSASAIEAFAGHREAEGYRRYVERGRRIYELVSKPFIYSRKPSVIEMIRAMRRGHLRHPGELDLHRSMWRTLDCYFSDERLKQLFGRYATYYGSSPFKAPGILNLISHVERRGVWAVDGGVFRIVRAMEHLLRQRGVDIHCGVAAQQLTFNGQGLDGVILDNGQRLSANAVVLNADVGALRAGMFGRDASSAVKPMARRHRTLSAVTFALVANTANFPLMRHNVFFSANYREEFADIFTRHVLPAEPSVYICAQDRDVGGTSRQGSERLLVLINAPARGDDASIKGEEVERCEERALALLEKCGLTLNMSSQDRVVTTPTDFNNLFPATGGALYGTATHGLMSSFRRPGSRSRTPGLYLSGGSVHPGAGVPMAAISGKLAAEALCEDLASTSS